jgi:hypothetical protein
LFFFVFLLDVAQRVVDLVSTTTSGTHALNLGTKKIAAAGVV